MDLQEQKIAESLRKLAQLYGGGGLLQGATVKSVDADKYTCDVETDNEDELLGVLYKSISGGDVDVVFQPAIESRVFIMQIADSDEWVIIKFGAVDRILISAATEIVFNGGCLGGMVKLKALVAKMNALESDLNTLKTAFNSWVIVPSDGGAALKTISATWSGQAITATTRQDLENDKVKQ